MIRIISLSLLTLMLSCGNTRPKQATETIQESTSEVPTTTQPEAPKVVAENPSTAISSNTEQRDGTALQSKPRSTKRAKATPKSEPKPAKVVSQMLEFNPGAIPQSEATPELPSSTEVAAEAPAITAGAAETTQIAPTTDTLSAESALSLVELPVLTEGTKRRVQRFLPTRKRMDREINKLKFAYKGEVMMGLTASYGTLSSDDTDFMLILDNIDAKGTIASVKPFIGYFYRDNSCLGVRFGYSHVGGSINSLVLDLGASNNTSFNVPYLDLKSDNYSFGIFHRSYAGLDPKGRFGLFAEFELGVSTGSSEFTYESGGALKSTFSDNTQVKLSFNPGAAVYIFPNVCATLSFGLGGLQYTSVKQKDAEGNTIGTRKSSNMKFKLNVAAINFGMTIHMWDKKKGKK